MSTNSRKGTSRARTYGSETLEHGEQVTKTCLVNHHPHPIDVTWLRCDHLRQIILIGPLKLRRGPPPPELVKRYSTSCDDVPRSPKSHGRNTSVAGIRYKSLAIVSYKDVLLRTTLE